MTGKNSFLSLSRLQAATARLTTVPGRAADITAVSESGSDAHDIDAARNGKFGPCNHTNASPRPTGTVLQPTDQKIRAAEAVTR